MQKSKKKPYYFILYHRFKSHPHCADRSPSNPTFISAIFSDNPYLHIVRQLPTIPTYIIQHLPLTFFQQISTMPSEQDTSPVPTLAFTSPPKKTLSAVLQDNAATEITKKSSFLHLKGISESYNLPSITDDETISGSNSSITLHSQRMIIKFMFRPQIKKKAKKLPLQLSIT